MGEELRLQSDETKMLSKERLALSEQTRVLSREVELKADMEVEWARQGARKAAENRLLRERVAEVEASLSREQIERKAERQQAAKRFESEVR
jgi:hypothetical protein